jgi:hypothetical protein
MQIARDPYGYLLSALQLQKLYLERSVAADKLASVTAVVDKRKEEWKRLVTPAAGNRSRALLFSVIVDASVLQSKSCRMR